MNFDTVRATNAPAAGGGYVTSPAAVHITPKLARLLAKSGCFNWTVCTLTGALVREQLEALPTVALEASDGVSAEVFAAAVVKLTLVDICVGTGEDILTAPQPDALHKGVTLTHCNIGPIPWCGWRCFANSPSDLCMFFHPAVA